MLNHNSATDQLKRLRRTISTLSFIALITLIWLLALINHDPVSLPVLISIIVLVLQGSAVLKLLDLYDELDQSEEFDR